MDTASAARQRMMRGSRTVASEAEEAPGSSTDRPAMAVSIAGQSRACTKDALVSQAKAIKKALSSE